MKKGKLHTLSKYEADRLNRVASMSKNNIFDDGGNLLDLATAYYDKHPDLYDPNKDMIKSYKKSKNVLGISKQANPFSKMNIGKTLGGAASVASPFITKALSNGYSTGVGNGISTVGNAVGDAIGGPYGAIVKLGASALGGIYNAAMGVNYNEDLIKGIKENTSKMEEAGNALAQANTNAGVLDAARNMGSTINIDYHDLGSTGFLRSNNALRREKARLDKAQNLAIAKQTHGLMLGANQADQTTDDLANSTFIAAYGGQLDVNNIEDNMGPTKYSLLMDDMERLKGKNNKTSTINYNYFGEAPSDNVFAKGGGIHINPKNKGKFTATKKRTGKTTEELTHSKNPLTRKRAIFAQNSRKWRHDEGGPLNLFDDGGRKWVTSVGTVGPGGFVPSRLGGYSGGIGGGGGAGTIISNVPEYDTTVENDTIWLPITRNFNQAWREAVRNGQDTLIFDGVKYPIEYSNNPNWEPAGNAREEIIDLVPIITEKKKTERKKAEGGPLNILCGGGKFFDLGGDLQTPYSVGQVLDVSEEEANRLKTLGYEYTIIG